MDGGPTASIILIVMVLINMIYNGFSTAMEQLNIKEIEEKALALAKAAYLHKAGFNGIPQANAHQQKNQYVIGQVGIDVHNDWVQCVFK